MKHRKRAPTVRPSRSPLAIRPAEQILIDAIGALPPGTVLCTSIGRGQFAAAAAQLRPDDPVCCVYLDMYDLERARSLNGEGGGNLRFVCQADFPEDEIDVFAMPTATSGDSELVREFLQAGFLRLRTGGTLAATTDNAKDSWLHEELQRLFPKVTRKPVEQGTLYLATKTEPLRKIKHYDCTFSFRDEGRLINAVSRPGVFSHRRVDDGARALLRTTEVRPGDRVLEIGCGSGVVSLAAALRQPSAHVLAIDSNVRAVQCTQLGVESNGITNAEVRLGTAESRGAGAIVPETFDLVLGNPPYFSHNRITEIFARCTVDAIKPDGTALFVTKQPAWFEEHLPEWFATIETQTVGKYVVVRARARR